jgi:hypothetical protein
MGVGGQRPAPAALSLVRPGTHYMGGWVGPRAGLDGCGKYRPHQDSIPGPSSPWRVAVPAELSRPTCVYTHTQKVTVFCWASLLCTEVSSRRPCVCLDPVKVCMQQLMTHPKH